MSRRSDKHVEYPDRGHDEEWIVEAGDSIHRGDRIQMAFMVACIVIIIGCVS